MKGNEIVFIAMDNINSVTEDQKVLHHDVHKEKFPIKLELELDSVAPTPLIHDFMTKEMRKKRAAVLICIFSGREGELRVILTRRSMKLSSHPGAINHLLYIQFTDLIDCVFLFKM